MQIIGCQPVPNLVQVPPRYLQLSPKFLPSAVLCRCSLQTLWATFVRKAWCHTLPPEASHHSAPSAPAFMRRGLMSDRAAIQGRDPPLKTAWHPEMSLSTGFAFVCTNLKCALHQGSSLFPVLAVKLYREALSQIDSSRGLRDWDAGKQG